MYRVEFIQLLEPMQNKPMTNDKPTYEELENQIAELKKQNEILSSSTSFKNNEKAKKSEVDFKKLYNNINDAVFYQDLVTGSIIFANETAKRIYGYSDDEFKKLRIEQIDNENNALKIEKRFKTLLEKGVVDFESVHITKCGKSIPVEAKLKIIDKKTFVSIARDITLRKKAEQALIESEKSLNTIIENIPFAVFVHSLDGEFIKVNNFASKYTGYSKQELMKMRVSDIDRESISRNDEEKIWLQLNQFGEKQIISNHYKKDGSTYPVEIKLTSITLKNEPILLSIVQDVSERQKAEKALQESEAKLSIILKSMDDIVFLLNKQNHIISVNGPNNELYLDPELLLGKKPSEIMPTHINDIFNKAMMNVKKGETEEYEYSLEIHDKINWYAVKLSPIFNNGKFDGAVSVSRNITARKNAEEALKESEYLYKETQKLGKMGGWCYDVESKQSTFTDTIYDIYGERFSTSEEGIVFYHPDDREIVLNSFSDAISKQKPYDIEVRLKNAQGANLFVRTIAKPIHKNGKVVKIYGNMVDITEKKTAELALKQSETQLKELNATKDRFFSILSHDLRNPFNAILGFSNILLKNHKNYDDEKLEKIFKASSDSANNALKLLENTLTWARSQSGRIEYLPEELHLKTILSETVSGLLATANNKNIQISNIISEKDIIYADKNMIATIFRNLISNAIKFTNKNGKIIISADKQGNSNFLEISVTDTGVGIPKYRVDDLFRIDKNISTHGTENEKGTGLGLILCKEFVEKHGGEIWVESELGVSSDFKFTMPLRNI
jgi:PAS domain S-box-containing protein